MLWITSIIDLVNPVIRMLRSSVLIGGFRVEDDPDIVKKTESIGKVYNRAL